MPTKVSRLVALLAVAGSVAVGAPSAHADKSFTVGKGTCLVKSNAPSLKSGFITSSVTISCTVSTSVVLEFGVVEMDGLTEDSRVEVPFQKRSITVTAGRPVTVPTATGSCVSTESSNEELATKSRISAGTAVSTWDRTAPSTDSYAC